MFFMTYLNDYVSLTIIFRKYTHSDAHLQEFLHFFQKTTEKAILTPFIPYH